MGNKEKPTANARSSVEETIDLVAKAIFHERVEGLGELSRREMTEGEWVTYRRLARAALRAMGYAV